MDPIYLVTCRDAVCRSFMSNPPKLEVIDLHTILWQYEISCKIKRFINNRLVIPRYHLTSYFNSTMGSANPGLRSGLSV